MTASTKSCCHFLFLICHWARREAGRWPSGAYPYAQRSEAAASLRQMPGNTVHFCVDFTKEDKDFSNEVLAFSYNFTKFASELKWMYPKGTKVYCDVQSFKDKFSIKS